MATFPTDSPRTQTTVVWNSPSPSVLLFYCSNFPCFLYATVTMLSIVHNSVTTWLSVSFLRFIIPSNKMTLTVCVDTIWCKVITRMEALVKHKENSWNWLAQYFNIFEHIPQITSSTNVTNHIKKNHLQATQEIHSLVRNPKVHQSVHKSPPSTDVENYVCSTHVIAIALN